VFGFFAMGDGVSAAGEGFIAVEEGVSVFGGGSVSGKEGVSSSAEVTGITSPAVVV